jgi:hypothetical protein
MLGEDVIALMTEYMKEYKYEQSAEAMNRTVSGVIAAEVGHGRMSLARFCLQTKVKACQPKRLLVLQKSSQCHPHTPFRPHCSVGGVRRRMADLRRTDWGGRTGCHVTQGLYGRCIT